MVEFGAVRSVGTVTRIFSVTVVALLSAGLGNGITIVVPNDLARTEGNGTDLYPFSIRFTNSSARYQQVYDASQFSQAPPIGIITAIRFRIDQTGYPFAWIFPKLQVNLSTVARAPDSLSANFADNAASNDTIVFGPGSLAIQSGFSPMGSPEGFTIQIVLATPFLYDPAAGNLLFDRQKLRRLPGARHSSVAGWYVCHERLGVARLCGHGGCDCRHPS